MKMNVFTGMLLGALLVGGCGSTNKQANNETNTQVEGTQAAASQASDEHGFTKYEDAIAKAKSENKLVMVDVYTDWCGWCKRMDKDVYSDKSVQEEMSKYFTAVKLNAEAATTHQYQGGERSEQQIAAHWGVSGYPTIVFMTPDEKMVQKLPGYVPAKEFVMVLRYMGTGAYQNSDYESWKKTQS